MIQEAAAQKKPLTAYLLFTMKEREANKDVKIAELGKKWKELSDTEKKPFLESYKKAKEKYEKYLVEVEGIDPHASEKTEKPTAVPVSRVRAICNKGTKVKPMGQNVYKGIARVVVIKLESTKNRSSS